jgi:hypothetical protein
MVMDLIAVFPESPSPELARTLDMAGFRWKSFASADAVIKAEPTEGWLGAIVMADDDMEGAWAVCRALRKRDGIQVPLMLLVTGAQLDDLTLRDGYIATSVCCLSIRANLKHDSSMCLLTCRRASNRMWLITAVLR